MEGNVEEMSLMTLVECLAKTFLLFSTGLFSGLCITVSSVCVPAIQGSSEPLRSWKIMFGIGKKIAMPSILCTISMSIFCFLLTGQFNFLVISGLHLSVLPLTQIYIAPLNEKLFGFGKIDRDTEKERLILLLIRKWSLYQFGRMLLALGAFVLNVYLSIWI